MTDPYFTDDTVRRAVIDIDAALDNLDFEEDEVLGSDDLNYALGRPWDVDFDSKD